MVFFGLWRGFLLKIPPLSVLSLPHSQVCTKLNGNDILLSVFNYSVTLKKTKQCNRISFLSFFSSFLSMAREIFFVSFFSSTLSLNWFHKLKPHPLRTHALLQLESSRCFTFDFRFFSSWLVFSTFILIRAKLSFRIIWGYSIKIWGWRMKNAA